MTDAQYIVEVRKRVKNARARVRRSHPDTTAGASASAALHLWKGELARLKNHTTSTSTKAR